MMYARTAPERTGDTNAGPSVQTVGFAREQTRPEDGDTAAHADDRPNAEPDHRTATDTGADRVAPHSRRPGRCASPRPNDEADAVDLAQDHGTRSAEPVDTNSNDEPAADANGNFDDERADENQAVPRRS